MSGTPVFDNMDDPNMAEAYSDCMYVEPMVDGSLRTFMRFDQIKIHQMMLGTRIEYCWKGTLLMSQSFPPVSEGQHISLTGGEMRIEVQAQVEEILE